MPSFAQQPAAAHPCTRIKQVALILCALILSILAACGQDDFAILCRGEGGQVEWRRPPIDEADRYCVFADDTSCAETPGSDRSCVWKGAIIDSMHPYDLYIGPMLAQFRSPLPSPIPASPLATPGAPVSPLAAPAPSSPLPTPTAPAVQYNPPISVFLGKPESLEELIDHAPLIFIGEVGPVEQYTEFVPIARTQPTVDAQGNAAPSVPVINLLLAGMSMTEFRLVVEEPIRDDGAIAAGEPIILRSTGYITERAARASQWGPVPFSFTGDRYLFLLTPYPDGEAYAFHYNVWSRLIVDGEILRLSNGDRDPLVFDDSDGPVTLDEFIQAVQGE